MLVAVVGATGTGKSAFALELVEALAERGQHAEVVNADALQLYRGMDIGTAKLPVEERRGIPHHLLDVLDVTETATVAAYQDATAGVISGLDERGVWPILVGGSGLYVSAVLFSFDFPAQDPALRVQLEADLEQHGAEALLERLRALDPQAASDVDPANPRRIVRALEVVTLTGQPFRASLPEARPVRPTRIARLSAPREELVQRLDARVEDFWRQGLLAEVERLRAEGLERGTTARQAIGYAHALQQLRGEVTEPEAIAAAQLATRRYARRQVSWFKRYEADDVEATEARAYARALLGTPDAQDPEVLR